MSGSDQVRVGLSQYLYITPLKNAEQAQRAVPHTVVHRAHFAFEVVKKQPRVFTPLDKLADNLEMAFFLSLPY